VEQEETKSCRYEQNGEPPRGVAAEGADREMRLDRAVSTAEACRPAGEQCLAAVRFDEVAYRPVVQTKIGRSEHRYSEVGLLELYGCWSALLQDDLRMHSAMPEFAEMR
jgi:hypothetical protein